MFMKKEGLFDTLNNILTGADGSKILDDLLPYLLLIEHSLSINFKCLEIYHK